MQGRAGNLGPDREGGRPKAVVYVEGGTRVVVQAKSRCR